MDKLDKLLLWLERWAGTEWDMCEVRFHSPFEILVLWPNGNLTTAEYDGDEWKGTQ